MKMLKPFRAIAVASLLLFGCSKSNNNPTPTTTDNYKISVVSGNNQTAAIGYSLKDSIVVKVTDNAQIVSGIQVQFIGSGCNEDLVANATTKSDGTAVHYWSLAGDQGPQTLRAVIIAAGKRVDSVNVNATAVPAFSLGLRAMSACVPNPGAAATRILQLSTGRLLACFPVKAAIRYSDDDGSTWKALTGFGTSHYVVDLAISPTDEIFAATENDGIFYSKDAGNTWTDISPATFNKSDVVANIAFTKSGKVILTGHANDIFITADKGKTWTNSATGLGSAAAYFMPLELNNGDFYILCLDNTLYKSTDGGKTWIVQNKRLETNVTGIYVDGNGWFYRAQSTPATSQDVIDVSKDNGVTFTNLVTYTANNPYLSNMSIQPDGLFYFGQLSYAICRIQSNGQIATYTLAPDFLSVYLVTKSHRFLYTDFGGIYYF